MTKQRDGVQRMVRARPARPIDPDGFVATFDSYGVTLKPLRARRPEATIYATWDQVYRWALIARVEPIKKRKRRVRRKR
jgi:hypothetical protein